MLVAGALVCAVGVLDDIFDLDALTKFGGQVVAVGVLVYSGIQFRYFYQPDGSMFSLDATQGALLTAVIVLATVNAVNFIDGLDGLAAGVIGISAMAFFLFCYQLTVLNEVDAGDHRCACSPRRWPEPAPASWRTTSTRRGCSWATAARC